MTQSIDQRAEIRVFLDGFMEKCWARRDTIWNMCVTDLTWILSPFSFLSPCASGEENKRRGKKPGPVSGFPFPSPMSCRFVKRYGGSRWQVCVCGMSISGSDLQLYNDSDNACQTNPYQTCNWITKYFSGGVLFTYCWSASFSSSCFSIFLLHYHPPMRPMWPEFLKKGAASA